jgi:hypothetical protein
MVFFQDLNLSYILIKAGGGIMSCLGDFGQLKKNVKIIFLFFIFILFFFFFKKKKKKKILW